MANRPTITDVAAAANVSVATVDRVLNGRQKVREETARRVFEAAREIGYHATGLIEQRMQADKPLMRFGFVLHKQRQDFYKNFHAALIAAGQDITEARVEVRIAYSPSQSPADFAATMEEISGQVDAIGATAITHNVVTEKIEDLQARGIPCFALLNDFAQGVRQSYVGLNNLKVGRIAASQIALSVHRPGKIAVFVGGYRWHGHELRETGFRSYFREYSPQFQILETLVNLETRQLTYEATLDLLDRHPDLRGIYCAGGGMEGAIAALREVRQPGDVALVVNELTPESRSALVDRHVVLVIGTPLQQVCRDVMHLMVGAINEGMLKVSGQHFLRPDLFLQESV